VAEGEGHVTGEGSEGALDGEATIAAEVANTPSMLFAIAGAPPRSIGRFTIIRELGAGSMGTVYMAYDDELDRRVAIKVIHTGGARGKERAKERAKEKAQERAALMEARVRREAMALARLSHPNVVQIYDLGDVLRYALASRNLEIMASETYSNPACAGSIMDRF
jgi:serine/threonine protein kinase